MVFKGKMTLARWLWMHHLSVPQFEEMSGIHRRTIYRILEDMGYRPRERVRKSVYLATGGEVVIDAEGGYRPRTKTIMRRLKRNNDLLSEVGDEGDQ